MDRIFVNFTDHIVEMIEQSARRRPIPWDAAVEEFTDRVQHTGLRWWLYGSGALAVRGTQARCARPLSQIENGWCG